MHKNIRLFHKEIDQKVEELEKIHENRLQCKKGCHDCCVDGITVFEIEADRIRSNHQNLLLEGMPASLGKCAFLDEAGSCRIYGSRPYVCRTQGLPLRWIEEGDYETLEYRDICPLNDGEPGIETLDKDVCWTLGPHEETLSQIQAKKGSYNRVALRDLFVRHTSK